MWVIKKAEHSYYVFARKPEKVWGYWRAWGNDYGYPLTQEEGDLLGISEINVPYEVVLKLK